MVRQSTPRTLAVSFSLITIFSALSPLCWGEAELLDFSSRGCGPCQQMRPTVRQVESSGYHVRHIDISREPDLAQRYGVSRVPTFIALVENREVARITGPASFTKLVEMLKVSDQKLRGQSLQSGFPRGQAGAVAPSNRTFRQQPSVTPPANLPRVDSVSVTTTPGSLRSPDAALASNQPMLRATVRIAVDDPEGVSTGTGTIVDINSGHALVLTCGHLFRSSEGKGKIEVTLFDAGVQGAQPTETVEGKLLNFDLERDLAVLVIKPRATPTHLPIGSIDTNLSPGVEVSTVGCNEGADPTVVRSHITSLDRYMGPPNIEVAGAPVEGRSGGGLINRDGQLIGVCFAADPESNEGLYCALPAIHQQLDEWNLSMVYQASAAPTASPTLDQAPVEPIAMRGQDVFPALDTIANDSAPSAELSPSEQSALEEIQKRGRNSEVICIIRPLDPHGKSEVITLNSVSPQFVQALANPSSSAPSQQSVTEAAKRLMTR